MANNPSPHDAVASFVARLGMLDAGGRARLKRNAGRTLNEARNAYQVFFGILPSQVTYPRDQESFFLLATLYALGTRRENTRPTDPPRNLGASLRRVRQQLQGDAGSDRQISLDKRVNALLEADREQLPFRLRQMISLLAANDPTKEAAVSWSRLLHDVLRWRTSEKKVQREWAEAYYVGTNAGSQPAANDPLPTDVAPTPQEEV